LFLGITGITPSALILLTLELFKIGDYKTNIGSVLFFNLFPITIGSVYEFYKSNEINYTLGFILLFTTTLGSYIGSILIVGKNPILSLKYIKYVTSFIGFIVGFSFLFSAYYEKF
jgi:uncharacterized membrane protein YfcA